MVVRSFYPGQHQQPGQEHHPDHHACRHQADRWEQAGQLRHGAAVTAASAAGPGHAGRPSASLPAKKFLICVTLLSYKSDLFMVSCFVFLGSHPDGAGAAAPASHGNGFPEVGFHSRRDDGTVAQVCTRPPACSPTVTPVPSDGCGSSLF